jgi:hypothetical protein
MSEAKNFTMRRESREIEKRYSMRGGSRNSNNINNI